jgi:hypothetical protein
MIRLLLTLFVLAVFLNSCEYSISDTQYNMGEYFIDDPANVILVDTMTVKSYSIVADSFYTSQARRLLAGRYMNKYDIETFCESYFRFDPTTNERLSDNKSAVYDSTSLVIYPDGYKFGDTTIVAGFDIYRVTQEIEYDEDDGYLYNTSSFETEDEPIGSFNVDFNSDVDSVIVKLPGSLGKELYDMVYDDLEILKEQEDFKELFLKGFKIAPRDDNESLIFGINVNPDSDNVPRIDLHYHDNTPDDNLAISFKLEAINRYAFSHIENSYSGSILGGGEADEALEGVDEPGESKYPSFESNEISISQAGYLLSTRIEIPYVDNLYAYGLSAIVKAELIIDPLDDSFEDKSDLPSKLNMVIVNEKNDYYYNNVLYEVGSTGYVQAKLHYDYEFKSKTHYRVDITNFIKTEYEDLARQKYSLLMLTPYNLQKPDVDQLFVGSPDNEDDPMELKVYINNF